MTANHPSESSAESVARPTAGASKAAADDLAIEAPEADKAEQQAGLVEEEADSLPPTDEVVEADPADRAEQARVVETDEDEYR